MKTRVVDLVCVFFNVNSGYCISVESFCFLTSHIVMTSEEDTEKMSAQIASEEEMASFLPE